VAARQPRPSRGRGALYRRAAVDEIAELGILLLADGAVSAKGGLLRDPERLARPFGREAHLVRDLLGCWAHGPAPEADASVHDPLVDGLRERFREENFPECFKEYADLLTWDKYWHTTLDTSNPPFRKWFVGGRLNASVNCVDRHLAKARDKAALIWVPEPEAEEAKAITYQELYKRVNEFAALLQGFGGVKVGDRVTFHMPMVPDLPVSMLACARLGVIHNQVFGGFSGPPVEVRSPTARATFW
jgi:hypothetical protein